MDERVTVTIQFVGEFSEALQADIKKIAHEQAEKLTGSYFQTILKKEDALIRIRLHMEKTVQDKYEGKFNANLDGEIYRWDTDVPFRKPLDVVGHAFKHLKEDLANK